MNIACLRGETTKNKKAFGENRCCGSQNVAICDVSLH